MTETAKRFIEAIELIEQGKESETAQKLLSIDKTFTGDDARIIFFRLLGSQNYAIMDFFANALLTGAQNLAQIIIEEKGGQNEIE